MNSTATESVLRASPQDYGGDFHAHLLEQYKICVEAADNISQRRASANALLLSVNAFLVSFSGLASFSSSSGDRVLAICLPLSGLAVCFAWWVLIWNYRRLNSSKFEVIHELEQQLPAAPFEHEWKLVQHGRGKKYKPLTHIEQWIPAVFGILYTALVLSLLCR